MIRNPRSGLKTELENLDAIVIPTSIPENVFRFIDDVIKHVPHGTAPEPISKRVSSAWSMFEELANPLCERFKDGDLPDTPQKMAKFIINNLQNFGIDDAIKVLLKFYGLPRPTTTKFKVVYDEFTFPTTDPPKFKLQTLEVKMDEIVDGDTFDVWAVVEDYSQVPTNILRSMAIYYGMVKKTYYEHYFETDIEDMGYRYLHSSIALAQRYRIQLRGVRAYKLGESYGDKAKAELHEAICGRSLTIGVYKLDVSCCIADVYVDGIRVQNTLLTKGAVKYCDADGQIDEFDKLHKSAEASGVGLWNQESPQQ